MKKTLALLLAMTMLVALCACGAEQAQEPAEEEPASAEVPVEEAAEPAGEEAAAEEESAETEESVETQDAPHPEENYQTITELGVSLRIPESWSWSSRKQAEGELSSQYANVHYNFNEIAGDPHRTLQIGFMQIDLHWDDAGLTEDEKYEQIGGLLESFNAAAADSRFSHTDDLYMGTAVLPLSGFNGRVTVLVSETHKVIVIVAALESPEMSEEYLEAYQEILDSIVFS